jgi:hypothetical protein
MPRTIIYKYKVVQAEEEYKKSREGIIPYDWETLGDFPPVKWKDGSTFEIVTSDGGKPHNHVSREDETELMDGDIWRGAKKVYQLSEDSTAVKLGRER